MLVTTGATAVILATRNRMRKSLLIQNTSTTDTAYVKRERNETLAVTSTDFDFKIGPGGAIGLNSLLDGIEAIQDRYSAIAAAGAPVLSFFETEDAQR